MKHLTHAVVAAIALSVCSSSAVCAQGTGPWLNPVAIAVEASGSLVVVDVDLRAVVRVDPATDDRVGGRYGCRPCLRVSGQHRGGSER
jgi:hypothetical protein